MATIKKYQAGGVAVAANTFVKLDESTQTATQTSSTAVDTLGVQLNATSAAGETAYVCVEGECLCLAADAIEPGEGVRASSEGKAMSADAPLEAELGIFYGGLSDGSYTATAANDLITIYVHSHKGYVRPE